MDDVAGSINRAVTALREGDPVRARRHAEAALALEPAQGDTHLVLGYACLALDDFAAALRHLDQAARLRPADAGLQRRRAQALVALRRIDGAIAALRDAARLPGGGPEDVAEAERLARSPHFAFRDNQCWPQRAATLSAAVGRRRPAGSSRSGRVRILEVGAYMGGSTLMLARALDRFHGGGQILSVDPWDDNAVRFYDEMDQLLGDGTAERSWRRNIRFAPQSVAISGWRAFSQDALKLLADGAFDLVFIDGAHA